MNKNRLSYKHYRKMGENLAEIQELRKVSDSNMSNVLGVKTDDLKKYKSGRKRLNIYQISALERTFGKGCCVRLMKDVDKYSTIIEVSENEKAIITKLRMVSDEKYPSLLETLMEVIDCKILEVEYV